MKKILLKIEYQGTDFKGWQVQPEGIRTVEGVIEDVLLQILQLPTKLHACSRTDSGVHALDQIAVAQIPEKKSLSQLHRSLNSLLPRDVQVVDLIEVPDHYILKNCIQGKRYNYRIHSSPIPPVITRHSAWWIRKPLNLPLMQSAATDFIGTFDFSAYRGKNCQAKGPIKKINRISVIQQPVRHYNEINITVEGSGFLKNQVRIMVGTLVDIGLEKRPVTTVRNSLSTLKRADSGQTAPALGLSLEKVLLSPDPFLCDTH